MTVRRVHATDGAYEELGPARQIVRQDLATLSSSPVRFGFGLRRATVTVVGFEAEADGADLRTTLIFAVRTAGRGWRISALAQRRQLIA